MACSRLLRLVPDAPQALCDMLNPLRGALEPPVRSEIFGLQRFAQHGRSLGATHRAARAGVGTANFFPRLQGNITTLREANQYIGVQASTGYDISPAAEWLLENFHLIEAQLKEIHEGLPRSYFRSLPVLLDPPLAGLPRIYGVAWAFVAHTDGAFDEDLLAQFLCAYQETRELNLSEMWALPTTLRVVLIENLRRLAERVAANKAARAVANLCCDHLETYPLRVLDELLALLEQRGVGRVFLAQMAQRLQDRRTVSDHAFPADYHRWLARSLPDLAAVQIQQAADQAADNLSVSNAVTSLRAISDADWPALVAQTSALMRLMLTAPLFEAEQTATRDQSLHDIERLARRSGCSEVVVAQTLLDLMRADPQASAITALTSAPAHWLRGAGRPALAAALHLNERSAQALRAAARRLALPAYLGTLLLGTLGLVAWLLGHHDSAGAAPGAAAWLPWACAALMLLPASETVVALVNRLISESARPQHLPRLALGLGIPPEHRVMVVMPAMLTDATSTRALVHRLHLHYLANPEPQAQFALLTDWADAPAQHAPADASLLSDALSHIRELNAGYPTLAGEAPRFILLHRQRSFSDTEQRWIGWERKRGKLELLVAALAQGSSAAFMDLGESSRMVAATPYIVTLDSDTQLPPGRLRELVGVAAHPHNQPRLGPDGRSINGGYGILQPRVATPLPSPREVTLYHWLFAGQCGLDPYSAASSEIYQDLFREGTFTGKGLLHVGALHAVLSHRLPEGQVLSHDLLEGALTRCAAVSDITLIEDAPFHADVAASRIHRWTRGDWQLLPFLFGPLRHHLGAIHRWKMFDNLRRSLVVPASVALLLLSLATGVVSPWAVLLLVAAAFSAGPLLGALSGFAPGRVDISRRHFYRQALMDLLRTVAGGLWWLAQLLQQALLAVDAIARALYRSFVSHRHLLQWTTAAAAQAQSKTRFTAVLRAHWSLPVMAALLFVLLMAGGTPHPWLALAVCLLWGASPVWTWWVSRPRKARADAALPARDRSDLDGIARDTWRFFERCIGPQDHHLPPDNLQTLPHDMVAHRTSPTNIGLYLLSVACARQFGWIGTQELLRRMDATLATLVRLQRHRGHFLNWYDTETCEPMLPMYVSTVDSGNLSGHLLACAQACRELAHAPLDSSASLRALAASRQRLAPLLAARVTRPPGLRNTLKAQLGDHRAMQRSAALDTLARAAPHGAGAADLAAQLLALADRLEPLAMEADFSFLYHPRRHLLHIGYRVADQQLDSAFYDLLASESRLTSLLAIAKGDVPVSHWAALGRPFYALGAQAGLRSWSGSMFEYLMPSLVLDEPHGSVLRDACLAAIREQIDFGAAQGVPWGLSESAYAGRDHTLAYQYAPQGVPRLALRRTPPDELVIAPYATALAAQLAPRRAAANFRALEQLQPRGPYGFIEALDFSPARQAGSEACTPVSTFMSHHQGMSIVALANVLLDGPARRWGMANPHIEAVGSLLHERAPRELPRRYEQPSGPPAQGLRRRAPGLLRQVAPGESAIEPTHMLSNGCYGVLLRANGAGASHWGGAGITRWRDDALRDAFGSFFYVRRQAWQPLASITQHPAPDAGAHYQSTFHADRVCFDAAWPDLQAHTTVWVSPEDDIEFRQVVLRNPGDQPLDIELVSAFEVTLTDARADEAHPAFTGLFVQARWQATHQALVFQRKPRLATEQGLLAAHFLAETDPQVRDVRVQTDRQRWLGRNRDASQPAGVFDLPPDAPAPPDNAGATGDDSDRASPPLDTGLDPVCALSVRLRIAPRGKAQLTFATAASSSSVTLHAVIDKYRQPSHVQRASLMSATLTSIRLRTLRITPQDFAAVQTLTTALVLSLSRPPASTPQAAGGTSAVCDRRLLWRFRISGDRPILLVSASVLQGLGLLRALAQALSLWSWSGVACDLVVVNAEPASYLRELHREIAALRDRHGADSSGRAGPSVTGFHLLNASELSGDELSTLHSLARVRLHADGRPLVHHVQEWSAAHELALAQRQDRASTAVAISPADPLSSPAPVGEFAPASGEFHFDAGTGQRPLRPWINVLANPGFGTQVSEAGGGCTWALNSRLNQLTAWSNDPVADPPGEWLLLQDRRTREVWSATPCAHGGASQVRYHVTHGQGYTTIRHRRGDVEATVSWCVDAVTAVKQIHLQLFNHGHRTQHLRVTGLVEWMMGANRADRGTVHTALHHQRLPDRPGPTAPGTTRAQKRTALLCTQKERAAGFGLGTAFFSLRGAADETDDWTCDRREFFDARGRLALPDHLSQQSGSGLDPCAALSTRVTLVAGQADERVFLLGYAPSAGAAQDLATLAATVPAAKRVAESRSHWNQLLGATTVATPDPLFDALVNRWLLYQAVSCRLWAKAGFYQAGGATGFRDQLQDAMALAWAVPGLLRAQIVLCASRQFVEGDVQHWWHAPLGAGVRTHFSDDLLWLPHACVHYLRTTGDAGLLDQRVPFIEGTVIPQGAEDAYNTPTVTETDATVYEHAARTIDRSLRVGVHGLPLMGSGDWNDGMNRVGIEGRGESVWLGWFLCQLVADFAPLARARGDHARAQRWEAAAGGWRSALNGPAWDGQWFRRAFFDNGQPLGSQANAEARIDLIAQAWAVLSGVAPADRQHLAMAAVQAHLVDPAAGLIKLLDPPLAHAVPSAGYIQAYPPGVRENGGQYTHAGIWALMAQARLAQDPAASGADAEAPYRSFTWLSPAHRAAHPARGAVYGAEPYAVAGDVYSQPPWVGRAGWSWYTGAAAWLHRAAIESIFGLQHEAQRLRFTPCLPAHWPRAELTLARDGRTLRFILLRADAPAAQSAVPPGTQQLPPGEWLHWTGLAPATCFVVPLPGAPA